MKSVVGLVVVTLALAACARPANWTKPGMTMEEFELDAGECDREASRVAHAEGAPGHRSSTRLHIQPSSQRSSYYAEHKQKYEECMKRKGYAPPAQ